MHELSRRLPPLESDRLRLRQLGAGDVSALFEIFSDPEVMKFWSSEPLTDLAAARALLQEIDAGRAEGSLFQWGIALKEGDQVVGTTSLASWDRAHRRAELGFALRRDCWGRGHGTEAVKRIVAFAFEELDLHRLEADVDPRNEASIRILKRLGFTEEGLLRERYLLGGETQDALFLGLLRSEWSDHVDGAPFP